MGQYHLESMFNPCRIAVVGVSEKKGSIGCALMENLRKGGFTGTILPVNPRYGTLYGYECVKSVCDLDPGVDLAIIATPIHTVAMAGEDAVYDAAFKRAGGKPEYDHDG